MYCCIPTPTTDSNTSMGMMWVTLNMPSVAGKESQTVREFHIVWREWSPCLQFFSNSHKTWHTWSVCQYRKSCRTDFSNLFLNFFFKFYISTVYGTAAVELSRMAGLFNRSVYYSVELSNFLCELDVIMKYSLYFVWHMKLFFVLFCRRQSQHSIFSQESDETCWWTACVNLY